MFCPLTVLNRAGDCGKGIYTINSLITVHNDEGPGQGSLIRFVRNAAQKGGGIYLESLSQLEAINNGPISTELSFEFNSANYGDAIYVSDETYFGVCSRGTEANDMTLSSRCFIQVISPDGTLNYQYQLESVTFLYSNSSLDRSALLYGGLLDRCTLDERAEVLQISKTLSNIDGVLYLKLILAILAPVISALDRPL